jgi:hypothetical protein
VTLRAIFSPALLWISRHRAATAVLLLALAIRVALPFALVPILESQVEAQLHAHARIGGVDLGLLRGRIVLEDVQLWPGDRPAGSGAEPSDAILACTRASANLEWLQLARRKLVLSELAFEGLTLHALRRASGEFELATLVRESDEAVADTAELVAEDEPAGWSFGLERLGLSNSHITLDDRSVEGPPLRLAIPELEVDGGEWGAGAGQLARFAATLRIEEEGRIELAGSARIEEGRLSLELEAHGADLQLRDSQAYAGALGWVDVRGRLGFDAHYVLDGDTRHTGRLSLTLEEGLIDVPGDDAPALEVGTLELREASIDLLERNLRIESVVIEGGSLEVHPDEPRLLPVVAMALEDAQEQLDEGPPEDSANPAEAEPWAWSLDVLSVSGLALRIHEPDDHLEIDTAAHLKGLQHLGGEGAQFSVDFKQGDGHLHVDGRGRVAPAGMIASVEWSQLDLARLFAWLPPDIQRVQSGESTGALRLAAGLDDDPARDPRELRIEGHVSLPELRIAAEDPAELDFGWKAFELEIESLRVPDLLPTADEPSAPGSPDIHIRKLAIDAPRFALMRTAEGLVLPGSRSEAPVPEEAASNDDTAASQPLALTLENLHVADGRVQLTDESYSPAVRSVFSDLSVRAVSLRWPEGDAVQATLTAKAQRTGGLSLSADVTNRSGQLELQLDQLPLLPFDPMTQDATGYSVARGKASARTQLKLAGTDYESDNRFTLHDLELADSDAEGALDEMLGMPTSLALALLRDYQGDITLDFPLEGNLDEARVGFLSALESVLTSALVGALSAPIKGIATFVPDGDSGAAGSLHSAPLTFVPGASEPTEASREQLARLADLVVPRPALRVTLSGLAGPADGAPLRERHMLEQLQSGQRPDGVNLIDELRLKRTLQARQRGEAAELSERDQRLLASALPDLAASQQALAGERARRVAQILEQEENVEPGQIAISDAALPASDVATAVSSSSDAGAPGVTIDLGAASEG